MPHIKVRGFVIREVPVGESDRIINILTADLGLITASARRSRRLAGAQLLSTQVFSLSDFELFCNKGHTSVINAELAEPFMALHEDLDRLVCASHLAEVLLDACRDDVAQPSLYRLWAYALQAFQKTADPYMTVHVAQLRLLSEIGLAPRLDSCVVCGGDLQTNGANGSSAVSFSQQACGLVCARPECRRIAADARAASAGVWSCLKHSVEAPVGRLFQCQASPDVRSEFCEISARYLAMHMEKNYTKLKMLESLGSLAAQQPGD